LTRTKNGELTHRSCNFKVHSISVMDRIEHLKIIYEGRQNDEKLVFEKIQDSENKYFFIPSLEGTNVIFALYHIYILHDFLNARSYFQRAASVALYMSEKYNARIIDSGIYPISYALLSDDDNLIKKYSVMKNPVNHNFSLGFQMPNAIQNVLLGNREKLDENIKHLERFVKLSRYKAYQDTVTIFKGFRNQDLREIELGLKGLLVTHSKRNSDPLISKFLSVDTAGYCKLAWMMGYEIKLGNDLVPEELMAVQPLPQYVSYDFLN
jgi:hypothetical protein